MGVKLRLISKYGWLLFLILKRNKWKEQKSSNIEKFVSHLSLVLDFPDNILNRGRATIVNPIRVLC